MPPRRMPITETTVLDIFAWAYVMITFCTLLFGGAGIAATVAKQKVSDDSNQPGISTADFRAEMFGLTVLFKLVYFFLTICCGRLLCLNELPVDNDSSNAEAPTESTNLITHENAKGKTLPPSLVIALVLSTLSFIPSGMFVNFENNLDQNSMSENFCKALLYFLPVEAVTAAGIALLTTSTSRNITDFFKSLCCTPEAINQSSVNTITDVTDVEPAAETTKSQPTKK